MRSYKIPPSERIVKTKDYQAIMKHGMRYVTRYFVILGKAAPYRRTGIIVSKKVGGSVQRHRVKRRIKECYRHLPDFMISSKQHLWVQSGWPAVDMVIIARQATGQANYHHLGSDLLTGILGVASKVHPPYNHYKSISTTDPSSDSSDDTRLASTSS